MQAPPKGGTPWNWGFAGDDWNGVDASGRPWRCLSGLRQSPINVPPLSVKRDGLLSSVLNLLGSGGDDTDEIPRNLRTSWFYPRLVSNGSNVEVINNGHTIQVEWLSPFAADVQIAVPALQFNTATVTAVLSMDAYDPAVRVRATPLQFHFHATSEHALVGRYFPLEMHIVHRVTGLPACDAAGGCIMVTGVLFELGSGGDNPLLEAIWEAMPLREGAINFLRAGADIRLGDLLPPLSARNYVTYEGSLTTPPCSEGLLWHVFLQPQKISQAQWNKYRRAVGFRECNPRNATGTTSTASHRRLLATAQPAGNPNNVTCGIAAYGYNFRNAQKLNDRVVKVGLA
ncbi:hypothetical protein PLESTB_001346600 [Pleodorina starrii]|uniref:Carbonic anhydrase n=1 Tax=Pleodorina starrii TaxID=330485 RepID=A0A9W6BTX3_9CHLO|nr:hypothetical protein PLESTM_001071000 [Pleodorina starrii]GLC58324.1 hypothetical protein PLESTB_001346600 [Pleodorina starrii]